MDDPHSCRESHICEVEIVDEVPYPFHTFLAFFRLAPSEYTKTRVFSKPSLPARAKMVRPVVGEHCNGCPHGMVVAGAGCVSRGGVDARALAVRICWQRNATSRAAGIQP